MRALYHQAYGSPDVLELREIDKPALTDDGVLVRVRASSVNPAEWYAVTGRPVGCQKAGAPRLLDTDALLSTTARSRSGR